MRSHWAELLTPAETNMTTKQIVRAARSGCIGNLSRFRTFATGSCYVKPYTSSCRNTNWCRVRQRNLFQNFRKLRLEAFPFRRHHIVLAGSSPQTPYTYAAAPKTGSPLNRLRQSAVLEKLIFIMKIISTYKSVSNMELHH